MKIRSDQVRALVEQVSEDVQRNMHTLEESSNSRAVEFEPAHGELRYVAGRSDVPDWRIELHIIPQPRDGT